MKESKFDSKIISANQKNKKTGSGNENKDKDKDKDSAYYIRHSASNYDTYVKQKVGGYEGFDSKDQEFPDLSEKGLELAERKAKEFFDGLDPKKDILFFASSNEARALATGNIYRLEAEKRGFEIIKPTKTYFELTEDEEKNGKTNLHKKTEGSIRMSDMLSLNPKNYSEHSIFVTSLPREAKDYIVSQLPGELGEKWLKAKEIIDGAPEEIKRKCFGEVYHRYADQIKELFPNVRNAQQMEKRFQNIIKLAQWGMERAQSAGLKKNLKILGFGHENYASPVLEKYFGDRDMSNCEALKIEISDDKIELERRGLNVEIEM